MGKVLVDTGFAECGFLSTRTFVPTPFAPVFVSSATFISPSHKAQRRAPTAHKQRTLSSNGLWAIAGRLAPDVLERLGRHAPLQAICVAASRQLSQLNHERLFSRAHSRRERSVFCSAL